jgi:hypothetical protein
VKASEEKVIAIMDLKAELARFTTLRRRTPETPSPSGKAFAPFAPYREGAVFTGKFTGESAWERHSNGDEIVRLAAPHPLAPHPRAPDALLEVADLGLRAEPEP